ncbi:hypothetical protein [Streptomyces avidinii]
MRTAVAAGLIALGAALFSPLAPAAAAGSAADAAGGATRTRICALVLGRPVADPPPRVHCGGGSLSGCRDAVAAALKQAAAATPAAVYPADGTCAAGTSGAQTRSSSARSAGSATRRSTGRTGPPTSR